MQIIEQVCKVEQQTSIKLNGNNIILESYRKIFLILENNYFCRTFYAIISI